MCVFVLCVCVLAGDATVHMWRRLATITKLLDITLRSPNFCHKHLYQLSHLTLIPQLVYFFLKKKKKPIILYFQCGILTLSHSCLSPLLQHCGACGRFSIRGHSEVVSVRPTVKPERISDTTPTRAVTHAPELDSSSQPGKHYL